MVKDGEEITLEPIVEFKPEAGDHEKVDGLMFANAVSVTELPGQRVVPEELKLNEIWAAGSIKIWIVFVPTHPEGSIAFIVYVAFVVGFDMADDDGIAPTVRVPVFNCWSHVYVFVGAPPVNVIVDGSPAQTELLVADGVNVKLGKIPIEAMIGGTFDVLQPALSTVNS